VENKTRLLGMSDSAANLLVAEIYIYIYIEI